MTQEIEGVEYGLLVYDVPTGHNSLYNKILKRIRRRALRVNLSVYLIKWGMREELDQLLTEAQEETGQSCTVRLLAQHPGGSEQLERMAVESLSKEIREVIGRLQEKIATAQLEMEGLAAREQTGLEVTSSYFDKTKERLQTAKSLILLFGFQSNLSSILDQALNVFEVEEESRRLRIHQRSIDLGYTTDDSPTVTPDPVVA